MNSLKSFIKQYYGTNQNMAAEFDVTPQTVGNWVKKSPRGALKYLPEMIMHTRMTSDYILSIVLMTEMEIKNKTK